LRTLPGGLAHATQDAVAVASSGDGAARPLRREIESVVQGVLLDAASSDELVGQRIGRFELLAVQGRGQFGTVDRARDTQLGRHVAVKVMWRTRRDRATLEALFHIEAAAAARLQHTSIVTLHDHGEFDPLAHSALSQVLHTLGEEDRMRDEARIAFERSRGLRLDERLLVEARYLEAIDQWSQAQALALRRVVRLLLPDDLRAGLELTDALEQHAQLAEAAVAGARRARAGVRAARAGPAVRREPRLRAQAARRSRRYRCADRGLPTARSATSWCSGVARRSGSPPCPAGRSRCMLPGRRTTIWWCGARTPMGSWSPTMRGRRCYPPTERRSTTWRSIRPGRTRGACSPRSRPVRCSTSTSPGHDDQCL
jgi:hypothetical protein